MSPLLGIPGHTLASVEASATALPGHEWGRCKKGVRKQTLKYFDPPCKDPRKQRASLRQSPNVQDFMVGDLVLESWCRV